MLGLAWRRQIGAGNGFAQVVIAPVVDAKCPMAPAIEIEFAGEGARAHSGFGSRPGWRRVVVKPLVRAMIPVPSGVRVYLAVGHTDIRRGVNSLALQVQEVLKRNPHVCSNKSPSQTLLRGSTSRSS